jgi:hypothetical protein
MKRLDFGNAKKIRDKYVSQIANLKDKLEITLLAVQQMDFNSQIQQQTFSISEKNPQATEDPENEQINSLKGKDADPKEDKEYKKGLIILTTWREVKTDKLLAFSLGVGRVGEKVHDVSHLNVTRAEFMNIALPIIQSALPRDIESALTKRFPPRKTYESESVDEFKNLLQFNSPNPFKTSLTPPY